MGLSSLFSLFRVSQPSLERPIRLSDAPRPLVLKLDAKQYRLDPYTEGLIADGFQVVRGTTPKEGLRLARRAKPDLCLVFDNPKAGLDGKEWLALQHADVEAWLVMIPLLIVAERKRGAELRLHELPGRVRVVTTPLELEVLLAYVHELLKSAGF
jgi:hypothetical protein